MTRPAVTCRQTDTLQAAARLTWDHDISAVAVVDDQGAVVGMLTDRDAGMAGVHPGETPLSEIPVHRAMSKQVFLCHPADTLKEVERVMATRQIRRLPVVDEQGRPLGILSLNDIVRRAASPWLKDGQDREVIETLASISQPHGKAAGSSSKAPAQQKRLAAV